jgi:hypothetical protein
LQDSGVAVKEEDVEEKEHIPNIKEEYHNASYNDLMLYHE